LAGVDPQMPWHIFRLLPEYKMEDRQPPDIEEISGRVKQCRDILPNTYFSNYIGTQLINTLCPSCAAVLLKESAPNPVGLHSLATT